MDLKLDIGAARQVSFVTKDLKRSMMHFAENFGIGPWFYEPKIAFKRSIFRGQDSNTVIAAGLSYSGPMQFEIIQPLDDEPSVYNEFLVSNPDHMQLQHINMWVDDLPAAVRSAAARGYDVVQESVTSLGSLYYLSHPALPQICLELSDLGPAKRRIFEKIAAAAAEWDGRDPVRKGFPV